MSVKGLSEDHILAGAQGCRGQREMARVGSGDDDQVNLGMGGNCVGIADGDARDGGAHNLGLTRTDDGEGEARHGADQGCMEGLASVAVANQTDADGPGVFSHRFPE